MRIAAECMLTNDELEQVFAVQRGKQEVTTDPSSITLTTGHGAKKLNTGELLRATETVETFVLELQSSSLSKVVLSEESAIIDFLLDSLLAKASVAANYRKIFDILVKYSGRRRDSEATTNPYADQSSTIQRVDTTMLFENLYAIASKKMTRRQGRMLLHEAASEGLRPQAVLALDIMKHGSVSLATTAVSELSESSAVNTQDANGKTDLYIAAERGDEQMCQLLFEYGADEHLSANAEFFPVQLTTFNFLDCRIYVWRDIQVFIDKQQHRLESKREYSLAEVNEKERDKNFSSDWDAGRGDLYVVGIPALSEYYDQSACYMYEVEVTER